MEAGLRRARGSPSAPLGGPMAGAGQGRKAFSSLARQAGFLQGSACPQARCGDQSPFPLQYP